MLKSAEVGPVGADALEADMALSTEVGAGAGLEGAAAGFGLSEGKVGGAACFTKVFAKACLICPINL